MNRKPIVLSFSGHDPSGGAGVQADIETIVSHHCHACSVITALTEQDSRNVRRLLPQPTDAILSQARTVLADYRIAAIKIGLLGHVGAVTAIHTILREQPGVPVVLDPVLAAGGGTPLADRQLLDAVIELLLPLTTVLTPNSQEARQLAGMDDLTACGQALRAKGAEYVLITGSHEATAEVHNQLFTPDNGTHIFHWQRLPHDYHGSGCTLASAVAALLAQGLDAFTAIGEAQDYTWQALEAGYRPGNGQFNPDRLFWTTP